jgi:hypothetical protein
MKSLDFIETHFVRYIGKQTLSTWNNEKINVDGKLLHFLKRNVKVSLREQVLVRDKDLIRVFVLDKPVEKWIDGRNNISLDTLISPLQGGKQILDKLDERLQTYNDVAINLNIPEIKEDIQKLLSDCNYLVASLGEELLLSQIKKYQISWDTLYYIIEKYSEID